MNDAKEQKRLTEQLFVDREYCISHPTYDTELQFYQVICMGDLETLEKVYCNDNFCTRDKGVLSNNPLRNAKYHLVVTIAMVTRFCIEKGLNEQKAYGLSDVYIQELDEAQEMEELLAVHKKAVFGFAHVMAELHRNGNLPKCIKLAVDYIYNHLNDHIHVSDIAAAASVSESYLRRTFQHCFAMSPLDYINEKKIEFARNRLMYTDISLSKLANDLNFSSQSHFTKVFKRYTGCTPLEYRNQHFRHHFMSE